MKSSWACARGGIAASHRSTCTPHTPALKSEWSDPGLPKKRSTWRELSTYLVQAPFFWATNLVVSGIGCVSASSLANPWLFRHGGPLLTRTRRWLWDCCYQNVPVARATFMARSSSQHLTAPWPLVCLSHGLTQRAYLPASWQLLLSTLASILAACTLKQNATCSLQPWRASLGWA